MKDARCVKSVLQNFCQASGLIVSVQKSHFLFSSTINFPVKREVKEILGFKPTTELGNYLGVPLLHGRVTARTFRDLTDRVSARLASWKAKLLSMAGRTTLVQTVTLTLPNHVMQSQ